MRRSLYRSLRSEELEARFVPAGNVNVVVNGDQMTITGDEQNNQILITRTANNTWQFTSGQSATTINGQAAPVDITFAPFGRLRIDMRGGGDECTLGDNAAMQIDLNSLSVDMGEGDDFFTANKINVTNTGTTTISGGNADPSGLDSINIFFNSQFAGNLNLITRDGNDGVIVGVGTTIAGRLRIDTGAGNDQVTLNTCTAGNVDLRLGSGNTFNVANLFSPTINDRLRIVGGNAGDHVTLMNTEASRVDIRLRDGDDELTIQSLVKDTGPIPVDRFFADMGRGADEVSSAFLVATNARFRLGAGNNTVNFGFGTVNTLRFDGGLDQDTLDLNLSTIGELVGRFLGGNDTVTSTNSLNVTNRLRLNGGTGTNTLTDDGLTQPADSQIVFFNIV